MDVSFRYINAVVFSLKLATSTLPISYATSSSKFELFLQKAEFKLECSY
jgi:hypothetical protein